MLFSQAKYEIFIKLIWQNPNIFLLLCMYSLNMK